MYNRRTGRPSELPLFVVESTHGEAPKRQKGDDHIGGVVRSWDDEEGWGVIVADQTPWRLLRSLFGGRRRGLSKSPGGRAGHPDIP